MRVALASCSRPPVPDKDAELLLPALAERGVQAEMVDWRDAGADWAAYDLVLISSTWDYHRHLDEFREWLRRVEPQTRLENPAALIEWNLDKRYLLELERNGVPTVPTIWVDPENPAPAVREAIAHEWDELVVKPAVDLGANRLALTDVLGLRTAVAEIDAPCLVQPFLSSLADEGELSLVHFRGELSHAIRKLPAEGDFRVQEQYGGRYSAAEPSPEESEIAQRALAAAAARTPSVQPPLYGRVDLVSGPEGEPCVIELELIEPSFYLDVAERGVTHELAELLLETA